LIHVNLSPACPAYSITPLARRARRGLRARFAPLACMAPNSSIPALGVVVSGQKSEMNYEIGTFTSICDDVLARRYGMGWPL
jgi:hypothetical protein